MMRYLINLCKLFTSDLLSYLRITSSLARFQAQNPTCKFYKGSVISNSNFGQFNVVFSQTKVVNSSVGSHTYIQKNAEIFNVEIGKFCSIAARVTIGPGLHYTNGASTHPSFYLKNTPLVKTFSKSDCFATNEKTYVGNDVWIGQNSIILDGVRIGNGAIVASGAIVTKDVEPYSVVGGVPAKHIKYRFDEETITKLEESKWWNYSEEWFEQNASLMLDMEKFIMYLNVDK